MAISNVHSELIKTQIASNLNIQDVTPHSKISHLVDGFVNEGLVFTEYADNVLKNVYIETCDTDFLDKAGRQEGLVRNSIPSLRFSKESMLIQLRNKTGSRTVSSIPKGATYKVTDDMSIRFLEETELRIFNLDPYPVAVDIIFTPTSQDINVIKDSEYSLDEHFNLVVGTPIVIPFVRESDDQFRDRLIYSRLTSKFGSDSAINLAISSSPLITHYRIDYTTNPIRVMLYNPNLLTEQDADTTLEQLAIPAVEFSLNQRKAFGTSFELFVPKKVQFTIEISKKNDVVSTVIPASVHTFVGTIIQTYSPGDEFVIDELLLRQHLDLTSESGDFFANYDVKFVRSLQTFTYQPDDNRIVISEEEYPYLISVLEV